VSSINVYGIMVNEEADMEREINIIQYLLNNNYVSNLLTLNFSSIFAISTK